MKIILNKCYGGFRVSKQGYLLYAKKKGLPLCAYECNSNTGLYEKVSIENHGGFGIYYFLKDFGDSFSPNEEDWRHEVYLNDKHRTDPVLIEVIEEIGDLAIDIASCLVVVDIPDGMNFTIDYYDGYEELHEATPIW